MSYNPTATQKKEDQALRKALMYFNEAAILPSCHKQCFLKGGTRKTKSRKKAEIEYKDEEDYEDEDVARDEEAEMIDSPSKRTNIRMMKDKKTHTTKERAYIFCEDPANYEAYETVAKLMLIGGTAGVVVTGLGSVLSSYSNSLVSVLGLPSIEYACGSSSYFMNELISNFIPGAQSCRTVTSTHQQLAAGAWASLIAIGAMFKIPLPSNVRDVPGKTIESIAKALCRYYKERELDEEMRNKFIELAEKLGPKVSADIDKAVLIASDAQVENLLTSRKGRSRSRSRSPIVQIAEATKHDATRDATLGATRGATRGATLGASEGASEGGKRMTRHIRVNNRKKTARMHKNARRRMHNTARRHKNTSRRTRRH